MHAGQAHVFIGKNKSLGIKELAVTSVPRISLFGGAKTNNIRRVIMEIEKICQKYTLVAFEIGGFNIFQNSDANWLYLDVHQSVVLEQFRYELAQSLLRSERMISDAGKSYDHNSRSNWNEITFLFPSRDRVFYCGIWG